MRRIGRRQHRAPSRRQLTRHRGGRRKRAYPTLCSDPCHLACWTPAETPRQAEGEGHGSGQCGAALTTTGATLPRPRPFLRPVVASRRASSRPNGRHGAKGRITVFPSPSVGARVGWCCEGARCCRRRCGACDDRLCGRAVTQRRLPAGNGGLSPNLAPLTMAVGCPATSPRSPSNRCRSWSSGTAGESAARHRARTSRGGAIRRSPRRGTTTSSMRR